MFNKNVTCNSNTDISQTQGAVLLEALVAVVILSVGLSVMVQSMVQNLKIGRQGLLYSQAVFLADDYMFDLLRERYAQEAEDQMKKKDGLLAFKTINQEGAADERLSSLQTIQVVVSLEGGRQGRILDAEIFMIRQPDNEKE